MLTPIDYLLAGLAAVAAGLVNAIAGGGTLITFPVITALGVPAVSSNVTNTVALLPGYLGASLAQWNDIKAQKERARMFLPAAAVGGTIGGLLLLVTQERVFRALVPYLILLAAGLLAVQEPLRGWLVRRAERGGTHPNGTWAVLPVGLASIYGGYFGAGMSVIVLAVLGLTVEDSLTRLNGLKQSVALVTNLTAALFFVFSGRVVWSMALVMALGSLLGGALGGKLAGKIPAVVLRWMVVTIGVIVAILYLVR